MANPKKFDELTDYGVHPPDAKPFSSRMGELTGAAGCRGSWMRDRPA